MRHTHSETPPRVYPRVCGGTSYKYAAELVAEGLSPRVRGNLNEYAWPALSQGSIPACAGGPRGGEGMIKKSRVYPRVCGGTPTTGRWPAGKPGLSPRVRGNPTICGALSAHTGSIPACAGEPLSAASIHSEIRVYPRVCGGTQQGAIDKAKTEGSIPACAGEPITRSSSVGTVRVYPRVCGGTARYLSTAPTMKGLSPRVRGNRKPCAKKGAALGSIPACAGEPAGAFREFRHTGVYPRVCGGTYQAQWMKDQREGLSPRVRGNRGWMGGRLMWSGSIPACAGEPGPASRPVRPGRVYPRVCGGTWTSEDG